MGTDTNQKSNQKSNNSDNIDQVTIEQMPRDLVIEISEENRADSSESLQPTITEIIPAKEMDVIRKSLENDNAGDIELPIQAKDSKKKSRKSKRAVIQKSYLDFMTEDEDYIWDSTSWKETDESSSDQDLPKERKSVNVEDGKV